MLEELSILLKSGVLQWIILLILPGYLTLYTIVNSKSKFWYFFPEWEKFDKIDRLFFSFLFSLTLLLITTLLFIIGYITNIYPITQNTILQMLILDLTLPIYYFISCFWLNRFILEMTLKFNNIVENIQLNLITIIIFGLLENFGDKKWIYILKEILNYILNIPSTILILFIEVIKKVPLIGFIVSFCILILISFGIITLLDSKEMLLELSKIFV